MKAKELEFIYRWPAVFQFGIRKQAVRKTQGTPSYSNLIVVFATARRGYLPTK
jgi:hypothetical protein